MDGTSTAGIKGMGCPDESQRTEVSVLFTFGDLESPRSIHFPGGKTSGVRYRDLGGHSAQVLGCTGLRVPLRRAAPGTDSFRAGQRSAKGFCSPEKGSIEEMGESVTECRQRAVLVCRFPEVGRQRTVPMVGVDEPEGELCVDVHLTPFHHGLEAEFGPTEQAAYLDDIVRAAADFDLVSFSPHKEVCDELVKRGYVFALVYPGSDLKDEYMQRMKEHGCDDYVVNLLVQRWDGLVESCNTQSGCWHYVLASGEYLDGSLMEKIVSEWRDRES